MKVVIAVLAMTCIASFASYCMKRSSGADSKIKILFSPWFYLGGVLYVLSACINIYVLQLIPYAVAMPVGALTYVWTMFLSNRLLHEAITKRKVIGMLIIFAGVICVAAGH